MSVAGALRDEVQIWRTVWQQVDAFIDRVSSARDDDRTAGDKMRALLAVAAAVEAEARLRLGVGFLPPLEQAEAAGQSVRFELEQSTSATEPDLPTVDPAMLRRLPGAYDVEIAVAPINVYPVPPSTDFDRVVLVPRLRLFDLYDEESRAFVPFQVPSYDFGAWSESESLQHHPDPDTGLFPLSLRTKLAVDGHGELVRWHVARDQRLGRRRDEERRVDVAALDAVLAGGSATQRSALRGAAREAAAACRTGVSALDAGSSALESTELGPHIDPLRADLQARATDYDSIDRLLVASAPDVSALLAVRGRMALRGAVGAGAPAAALQAALDEAVDARIAYPDGTLRMLRTMEWSFRLHWPARQVWFDVRRTRRLEPLLDLFLGGFVAGLRAAVHRQAGALTFEGTLAQPAATGAQILDLAPLGPGGEDALALLPPGTVAFLDGARRTLAVCLREEPVTGGGAPRLRIAPLAVSLAGGAESPGIAGLMEAGARVRRAAPAEATEDAFLLGGVPGHPEHDGVPLTVIALWSRLSLLLGTAALGAELTSAAGQPAPALSALSLSARLPVMAPVAPGANRLVLDVAAVLPVFDLDNPDRLSFARQGELLLLRGEDADGVVRQAAVEILAIARTDPDKVDDETATAPLERPVCCHGPGERVVVQLKETRFDAALERNVSLHRDFRGFGAPSLAAGALLPDTVDASAATAGEGRSIDRSLELDLAARILKEWMS